jgi:hypothetical protein
MSPSSARELELSVYWGQLPKDTQSPQDIQESDEGQTRVFIYGFNTKSFNMASHTGTSNLKTGLRHLPVASVQALHEGLMSTLELAENEFQPVPQTSTAGKERLNASIIACVTSGRTKPLQST